MSVTRAVIAGVRRTPAGSSLSADHVAGDTVLNMSRILDFAPTGGVLMIGDETLTYTVVDDDASTVKVPAGLGIDYELGTPVAAIDDDGQQAETWTIDVDLRDGGKPLPATPDHGLIPYLREDDSLIGIAVDVDSDPTGYYVRTIPGRSPSVDGQFFTPASVEADKLTTSAGGNDILNGTFEDGGSDLGQPFAGWRASWWVDVPTDSHVVAAEDGSQIAGNRSLSIVCDTDAAGRRVVTDRIYPVTGGDQIEITAKLQGSRTIDKSALTDTTLAEITVQTAADGAEPNALGITDGSVIWTTVVRLDRIDTTVQDVRGSMTVPIGHTQMRVSLLANASEDGSGWTLTADEVHKGAPATVTDASTGTAYGPTGDGDARFRIGTYDQVVVDSTDDIIIGGQTLTDILAAYTRATAAPTTKTYLCNAAGQYAQDGHEISSPDDLATGDGGSDQGNRKSAVWFPTATIQADMTGHTITKVELYLMCSQRAYYATAGKCGIGWHNDTVKRSTWSAVTGKSDNVFQSTGWQTGVGKWIDITAYAPTDWKTGAKSGVLLGPGLSGAKDYAQRFDGKGRPAQPKLRITYT